MGLYRIGISSEVHEGFEALSGTEVNSFTMIMHQEKEIEIDQFSEWIEPYVELSSYGSVCI